MGEYVTTRTDHNLNLKLSSLMIFRPRIILCSINLSPRHLRGKRLHLAIWHKCAS